MIITCTSQSVDKNKEARKTMKSLQCTNGVVIDDDKEDEELWLIFKVVFM